MRIELRRVYDKTPPPKGYRVLVDRLWPRGIKKESLPLDEWSRDVAPSTDLRKWFAHEPSRWRMFRTRYLNELKAKQDILRHLRDVAKKRPLVLLYSAKDEERNQAVVIRDALERLDRHA